MSAGRGAVQLLIRNARRVESWTDGTWDLGFRDGELVAIERAHDGAAESTHDADGAIAVRGLVAAECDLECVSGEVNRRRLGQALQRLGYSTLLDHGVRLSKNGERAALEQHAERVRREFPQRVAFIPLVDPRLRGGFDLSRAAGLRARNVDDSPLGPSDLEALFALAARKGLPIFAHPFDAADLSARHLATCDEADWARRTQIAAEIESLERLLSCARTSGAILVLSPLASAAAVDHVEDARREGVSVRAGTRVVDLLPRAATVGRRRLPPTRGEIDRQRLVQAVEEGTLTFITSESGSPALASPVEEVAEVPPQTTPIQVPTLVSDLLALERATGVGFDRWFTLANDGPLDAFAMPREPRLALGSIGDLFLFDPRSGRLDRTFPGSRPPAA